MTKFDLIVSGATIYDGSGTAPLAADLAIAGDRIAALGDLRAAQAERRIDGAGLALAPGFIDAHAHDDRALLSHPDMAPKASQGVTTTIVGNCGISLAGWQARDPVPPPLDILGEASWWRFPDGASYRAELEERPAAINAAYMIGHQTLRLRHMSDLERPASIREIDLMSAALDEGMRAGAIGFSTGLEYPANRAATTDEIVAIAGTAGAHGGIYATHLRNEGDRFEEAVEEALTIGRRAGLPIVLSHHKAIGVKNHGKVAQTLARVDRASREQEVGLDVYPYIASSTMLDEMRVARSSRVLVTWSQARPDAAGRDLAELAAEAGVSAGEMVARLAPAGAIYFAMSETDVRQVVAHPASMIGSDGLFHDSHPHPRLWGTFARVLGHYARDEKALSLAEAVRKMTSLPAKRFGLKDRGRLAQGAFADFVLFDPATVEDRASFEHPTLPAAGIAQVFVNGGCVWKDGAPTGARPGRLLRRNA